MLLNGQCLFTSKLHIRVVDHEWPRGKNVTFANVRGGFLKKETSSTGRLRTTPDPPSFFRAIRSVLSVQLLFSFDVVEITDDK